MQNAVRVLNCEVIVRVLVLVRVHVLVQVLVLVRVQVLVLESVLERVLMLVRLLVLERVLAAESVLVLMLEVVHREPHLLRSQRPQQVEQQLRPCDRLWNEGPRSFS